MAEFRITVEDGDAWDTQMDDITGVGWIGESEHDDVDLREKEGIIEFRVQPNPLYSDRRRASGSVHVFRPQAHGIAVVDLLKTRPGQA